MELANHHLAADIVTVVPGSSKLVGEIPMRNSNYRISKNLCTRLVLVKKRAIVISQWRDLPDTTEPSDKHEHYRDDKTAEE